MLIVVVWFVSLIGKIGVGDFFVFINLEGVYWFRIRVYLERV